MFVIINQISPYLRTCERLTTTSAPLTLRLNRMTNLIDI